MMSVDANSGRAATDGAPPAEGAPPGERRARALAAWLFAQPQLASWAVLDGASIPGLVRALEGGGVEHACLLAGKLEPAMRRVAPYLARLEPGSPFTRWLLGERFGRHFGFFARGPAELRGLRKHLRGFLRVKLPGGKRVHFRYYDPRVLRVFLPTCEPEELELFFGPLAELAMEDAEGGALLVFDRGSPEPRVVPLKG